ncbi:MAG: hypothetical protein E7374_01765 [Clostridiales bacterium]|nr:hypothetical protein [Clostridiales bacterium]
MENISQEKYEELIHELYVCLCKDMEISPDLTINILRKRAFVAVMVSSRMLGEFDENINSLYDSVLNYESVKRGIVKLEDIKFKKNMGFVIADPFVFDVDVLVMFEKNLNPTSDMLNELFLRSGIKTKEELFSILKRDNYLEKKLIPYIVDGGAIPSKKIAVILVDDIIKESLIQCAKYLFDEIKEIKSVAFVLPKGCNEKIFTKTLGKCCKKISKKIKCIFIENL